MSDAQSPKLAAILLADVRALAVAQGRSVDALLNEAVADYLAGYGEYQMRSHVKAAYEASHDRYASVYGKLVQ